MSSQPPPNVHDLRLTERRNPRSEAIDAMSAIGIARLMNADDAAVALAVEQATAQIAQAIDLIAHAFSVGRRLLYIGAGTSGRLGVLDASECPPTFSTPPEMVVGIIAGGMRALTRSVEGAEDDVNAGISAMDAHDVRIDDVVVGIAASGTTPYVNAALGRAQALGARTVIVACAEPPVVLRQTCDACIVAPVGPEVVTGSTRLKAGTATKMILNMLTTGAMVRVGKTYGNLMVDLRASNAKLTDRAERIVMEVTGGTRAQVQAWLALADGEVKTAIVMARMAIDADESRRRIAAAGGRLREVIGDPPPVSPP